MLLKTNPDVVALSARVHQPCRTEKVNRSLKEAVRDKVIVMVGGSGYCFHAKDIEPMHIHRMLQRSSESKSFIIYKSFERLYL
jgi:hypothetical protein